MARLSLCLLSSLALAMLGVSAAGAEAAPPKPALTETNPKSSKEAPAESLEPLLIGKGEPGAETQVVRSPLLLASRPIASFTQHPEYEIEIFAKAACAGPVVAKGTAEELEDTGIPAPAGKDALTEFSAQQIDPGEPNEPSICSFGRKYWEGNPPPESEEEPAQGGGGGGEGEGPGAPSPESHQTGGGNGAERPVPPRLRIAPAGRANDNTPEVIGSVSSVDAVRLYANSSCSGLPVDVVSPSELSAGVPMHVPDNSVTDFTGLALNNGKQSFCSPPATYIEDSTAPRTRITMGPGVKTRHRKVVFRFADTSGDPTGTSFVCKVDKHKWRPCQSPFKLRHLGFHRYILRVRGIDVVGNAEAKPAKRSFKVVR
ncbi:MAG TPA: hypothetical protein VH042_05290 [Solirubrobacterales bacterium]|jgi:hypothetical protein|nr:hypothetical protein [Solirubrobacterales bacterium]